MGNQKKVKFDTTDVELLTSVVEVIPNLTEVAHAAKLVRKQLKYPINNRGEILSLFNGKKTIRLGDQGFTVTLVEQFLLDKFFPIDSEPDLIRKLLIAFQIGDFYHTEELMRKAKSDDTPAELLPGPIYHSSGYLNLRRLK